MLSFQDLTGHELAYIREKVVPIRGAYHVYRQHQVAVKLIRRLQSPRYESFWLQIEEEDRYTASGDFSCNEYGVWLQNQKVAEVSSQFFGGEMFYSVSILADIDHVLLLASTVILDHLAHPDDR